MNPDILSYQEKARIASELLRVVDRYFKDWGNGYPSPHVTYSQYDIKEYTFSINSSYGSTRVDYRACVAGGYKTVDLNAFKADVRSVLKDYGFKKVSFDLSTIKVKGDQNTGYYTPAPPVYTYKQLNAIYFAQ